MSEKTIDVAAAVIIDHGKILLTRRKRGEDQEGFWEFPGGKIEKGETPQVCLEREIAEELGVQAIASDIIIESKYEYSNRSIRLIAINAKLLGSNISLRVHDKYEWVAAEDLLSFKLSPADIAIAAKIFEMSYIKS